MGRDVFIRVLNKDEKEKVDQNGWYTQSEDEYAVCDILHYLRSPYNMYIECHVGPYTYEELMGKIAELASFHYAADADAETKKQVAEAIMVYGWAAHKLADEGKEYVYVEYS